MLLKEFYTKVLVSESTAVNFLREHKLLDAPQDAEPCHRCGSVMQEKRRRERGGDFRLVLRCPKKGCQTSRSVRKGNTFFHYTDINNKLNCNLSLSDILELVFFFILELPIDTATTLTGKSHTTVSDWYNMCREVCGAILRTRHKMLGTEDNPILIDELRYVGKVKHNCSKMLNGDKALTCEDNDRVAENKKLENETEGPWVFGLKQESSCRYFYVKRRDRNTLVPIIERECEVGSVIHSDDWPAYGNLGYIGYRQIVISHKANKTNSDAAMNTKGTEVSWLDTKIRSLKKMRGVTEDLFQSHLDQICWKVLRKDVDDLFVAFLNDIRSVYRQNI